MNFEHVFSKINFQYKNIDMSYVLSREKYVAFLWWIQHFDMIQSMIIRLINTRLFIGAAK